MHGAIHMICMVSYISYTMHGGAIQYVVCGVRHGKTQIKWGVQVCTGMHMYVQVCTGMYRYVHVCTGVYMYAQVCTGMYRYVQVCTGMYRYVRL